MPDFKPTLLLAVIVTGTEEKVTKAGKPYTNVRAFTNVDGGEKVFWDLQVYDDRLRPLALQCVKGEKLWVEGVDASSEWEGKTYHRLWATRVEGTRPLDLIDSDDIPF